MKVINQDNQRTVCSIVTICDSMWSRAKGLLGKTALNSQHGVWLKPCNAVHTCFMRFSIDVVFLNADYRVVKLFSSLGPWNMLRPVYAARSVLEISAGQIQETNLRIDTSLEFIDDFTEQRAEGGLTSLR